MIFFLTLSLEKSQGQKFNKSMSEGVIIVLCLQFEVLL